MPAKMKYSGRVFNVEEFAYLDLTLSAVAQGTISEGRLKIGDWVKVTPHGDRWAEIVAVDND